MPPAFPEKCEPEALQPRFCFFQFLPVFLGGFPCAIQ